MCFWEFWKLSWKSSWMRGTPPEWFLHGASATWAGWEWVFLSSLLALSILKVCCLFPNDYAAFIEWFFELLLTDSLFSMRLREQWGRGPPARAYPHSPPHFWQPRPLSLAPSSFRISYKTWGRGVRKQIGLVLPRWYLAPTPWASPRLFHQFARNACVETQVAHACNMGPRTLSHQRGMEWGETGGCRGFQD